MSASLIISTALLIAVSVGIRQRDVIFDWLLLRGYTPSQAIAQLAADTTMSSKGRAFFYINHPRLDGKTLLSEACPADSEKTIVLGCYHPVERGIFLYDVHSAQLDGVEQVTAAHEMLHAAYDRLSSHERAYVNGLLEDYYKYDLHDPTVKAEITAYKQSEPHDVVNEMHSVFGTEIAKLPAPLEHYYEQYFTNRQKIVQYAANYRAAFTSRESMIDQYDTQLANLKSRITSDETAIDNELAAINTSKSQLDRERSSDVAAYNAGVLPYNAAIDHYNALISTTKQLIEKYNSIVDRRNGVAFQEQQLEQALSSTPIHK